MTKATAALQKSVRDPDQTEAQGLTAWALVELFGHQRIVGMVTVDPIECPGLIRVDVPDLKKNDRLERAGFTRYIGRGAVYGITPVSEEMVRRLLPEIDGRPVRAWELDGQI
jgi:hypothetical protein